MAGLKRSADVDGRTSLSTAKTKKGRSNEKISALSAEYIVDSDSDTSANNAISAVTARNTSSIPVQRSSQPPLTKSSAKPVPKATLPIKRKSPDSNEDIPAANKKLKTSSTKGQNTEKSEAPKERLKNTAPAESRPATSNHREKKASGFTTNSSTGPNSKANGTSKSKHDAKNTPKARAPVPTALQNGAHNDSSSDEEESEAERRRTGKLTNQLAVLTNGSGVSVSQKPHSSPEVIQKAPPRPSKQQDSEAHTISSASDDSGGEREHSESGSDSESESSQSQQKATSKNPPPITKPSAPPIPQYKPPPGFTTASNTSHPSSSPNFTRVFSQSNLASKQIWHFTLPASVPVSAIKSVSMDSIEKGTSAFTYKGTDYALISDTSRKQATTHLLIPTENGSEYKAAPRSIARTLHLQQVLRLPDLSNAKAKNTNEAQSSQGTGESHNISSPLTIRLPPPNTLHEQPKGLRMRYIPFGDQSNDPINLRLDSDEEGAMDLDTASPAKFRMPAGYRATLPQETPRHDEAGSSQAERRESPVKKRKKHRKEREGSSQVPVASQSSIAVPNSQVADPVSQHRKHRKDMEGSSQVPVASQSSIAIPNSQVTNPKDQRKEHKKDREASSQVTVTSQSSIAISSSQAADPGNHLAEGAGADGGSRKHNGETAEEAAKRRAERQRRKQERRREKAEREGASS
ncbi:hypothetical protein MMC26_005108 [Xylographa opegraphella]|nr:hypothetical protein [Xylographa opegraphella]